MYSTQKNISLTRPKINNSDIVGKYLFYPDLTGKRIDEGGLRLSSKYKNSLSNKPLVSVITTVLNRSLFIEKAICSILTQDYDNIEYIIVDGASTDNTLEKILKYKDAIDYYVSEPDLSLYQGINKGLALSTGDYILILNSDDWYTNNCVATLVDFIKEKDVDMVSALAVEVDMHGDLIRKIPMLPFKENVRLRMPLRHETMLISKHLYNKVGCYDETFKIIADLKLAQLIYNNINSFFQCNNYLMYFRKIGIASVLSEEFIDERKRLIMENFPFLDETESDLLANEYSGEIDDYTNLISRYSHSEKLKGGILSFLNLHGISLSME